MLLYVDGLPQLGHLHIYSTYIRGSSDSLSSLMGLCVHERIYVQMLHLSTFPDGVGTLPVCRNELGKQRVEMSGYLRIRSVRDGANAAHRAAAHNR